MSYYNTEHKPLTAWISEDGSWSSGNELLIFDGDLLTDKQWDTLSDLPDSERIIYAMAVINGEDLDEWENE
jgi:hypothetical protein